ncbi:MAG: nucleoside triphosphate pyrophosphohydrolase family protein [Candidatus Cloacimonadaceae bacterium]|jgi:NTP pyrophosphatase (non-canonical NTP hydrolase)
MTRFDPNSAVRITEKLGNGVELTCDDIPDLLAAIDYWRHGLQDEHQLAIALMNSEHFTFLKYQMQSARTLNTALEMKDQLNNYVFGLVGEVGETVDLLKKFFYHGHEIDKQKLKGELGDILWYVAAIATLFELDLQDIALCNVEKLSRRYPNGFNSQASANRKE